MWLLDMTLYKNYEMQDCFSHRMREDIEDQEICMEKTTVFCGNRELSCFLNVCPAESFKVNLPMSWVA